MRNIRVCSEPYFTANPYRWAFCYLDGSAEELCGTDIFFADQPKPEQAGVYNLDLVVEHGQIYHARITLDEKGVGLVRLIYA